MSSVFLMSLKFFIGSFGVASVCIFVFLILRYKRKLDRLLLAFSGIGACVAIGVINLFPEGNWTWYSIGLIAVMFPYFCPNPREIYDFYATVGTFGACTGFLSALIGVCILELA